MKKYTKVLALALALAVLMSMSIFAADYEVKGEAGYGATAVKDGDKFSLTANADAGEMYLLLVLDASKDDGIPTATNILYVNQETASGTTVTFDKVYPNKIADSNIYLAGGNLGGLTKIALLDAEDPVGVKGDANLDTIVTADDATLIMQHLAGMLTISDAESLYNAEVNGDTVITADDATKIMQYLAGMIGSLE